VIDFHFVGFSFTDNQILEARPCVACNVMRAEAKGVFMLIICTGVCGHSFHCHHDCANPLPTPQQRKLVDKWRCNSCREGTRTRHNE
jgi:hypothetical protein